MCANKFCFLKFSQIFVNSSQVFTYSKLQLSEYICELHFKKKVYGRDERRFHCTENLHFADDYLRNCFSLDVIFQWHYERTSFIIRGEAEAVANVTRMHPCLFCWTQWNIIQWWVNARMKRFEKFSVHWYVKIIKLKKLILILREK